MFRIKNSISKLPENFNASAENNSKNVKKVKPRLIGKVNNYLNARIKGNIPKKMGDSPEVKSVKNEVKRIKGRLSFTEALSPCNNSANVLGIYWRTKTYLENAERIAACVEFLYKKISLLERQAIAKNKGLLRTKSNPYV